jgi:vanillate O-demethylase monooxygenase subunit
MRGFHGITPATADTCYYFWSMAANKHPDMPENIAAVIDQTQFTFAEDRSVIEQQWSNMLQFGDRSEWVDIHVDAGANRARRIVQRLLQEQSASRQPEHKAAVSV